MSFNIDTATVTNGDYLITFHANVSASARETIRGFFVINCVAVSTQVINQYVEGNNVRYSVSLSFFTTLADSSNTIQFINNTANAVYSDAYLGIQKLS